VGGEVSVVVVTRNRRQLLAQTLRRLRTMPECPPVVVVDNGSSDGTADEVARGCAALIRVERNLGAAGRTLGVWAARTPYVAFCDDDSWWAPGSLHRAAETLAGAPRLGLLAAQVVVEPASIDDPIGVGGEEDLLALDLTTAGWWCCYAPEVVAHHAPAATHRAAARRRREMRNSLWTAWLRRRRAGLIRCTSAVIGAGWRDPQTWAGVGSAVTGLPWVLAPRRQIDPATEAMRAFADALGSR